MDPALVLHCSVFRIPAREQVRQVSGSPALISFLFSGAVFGLFTCDLFASDCLAQVQSQGFDFTGARFCFSSCVSALVFELCFG
jgi:hypothetical protein